MTSSPAADRAAALTVLAEAVRDASSSCRHPLRVAVDGPDAAGKTTLADDLAMRLLGLGRDVVRASVDGFHHPRAERYRQGPDSARGYYEDAFDYKTLRRVLLAPLGERGERRYQAEYFDYRADTPLPVVTHMAAQDTVLILDGVFLLRPELRDEWDLAIFVTASAEERLRRAHVRDAELFGSAEEMERRYRSRYLPAQELYRTLATPQDHADFVVHNDDPARPVLVPRRSQGRTQSRSQFSPT